MAKLSFLDENGSGDETQQSFVPKLSKFKTRKREFKNLSNNNNTSNKSTINKRYPSFDEEDDTVDDIKICPTSKVFKPKENVNLENNILSDNIVKEITYTKSEKNIQDYLNSYGDTSFVLNKEIPEQVSINKVKEDADGDEVMSNDTSYKVSDNDVEGFIIAGSDLEDDSGTEQSKQVDGIIGTKKMNNNHIEDEAGLNELNTQKFNAKRRKEIEDALLNTSLNDLSNSEESDDEKISLITRTNDYDKNNTFVVNFDFNYNNDDIEGSDLPFEETKDKSKSNSSKSEVRLVCYNVNPLLDQLNSTDEKLKTIHNIITKREIQMNHLESEHEKINSKRKEYIEKLRNSFQNLQ